MKSCASWDLNTEEEKESGKDNSSRAKTERCRKDEELQEKQGT